MIEIIIENGRKSDIIEWFGSELISDVEVDPGTNYMRFKDSQSVITTERKEPTQWLKIAFSDDQWGSDYLCAQEAFEYTGKKVLILSEYPNGSPREYRVFNNDGETIEYYADPNSTE